MKNITTRFEVYEDNSGSLYLAILDNDHKPTRIFEGWEFCGDGVLADALAQLAEDPTAYECWKGDLMERLTDERDELGLPEITIGEMYEELNGEEVSLVADNDGVYSERMGAAAALAFDAAV